MENEAEIIQFVETIRQTFPNAAAKTDEIMHNRGFTPKDQAEYLWVEAFADVTNMYMQQRNQMELKKHLRFFSEQFDCGSSAVKNCIDVAYVENLMFKLRVGDKKWSWQYIPVNLKELYVAMWGKPNF